MPRKISFADLADSKRGRVKDKNYTPPKFGETSYHCSHCGNFANHEWFPLTYSDKNDLFGKRKYNLVNFNQVFVNTRGEGTDPSRLTTSLRNLKVYKHNPDKLDVVNDASVWSSICTTCNEDTIWCNKKIVYPDAITALSPSDDFPEPNNNLPEKALADYKEAAAVFSLSPRAAAALLRLATEEICVHVKCKGTTLQKKMDYLINQNKIPKEIAQAMDAVRIIGNEAVHPGTMDLRDNARTVHFLFKLVNRVAERLITEPLEIEEFYASLPDSKKRKKMPSE